MKLIVAMDKKGGIGKDGGIPWFFPADLKYFKEMTLDHPVIQGFNTFLSIFKILKAPLPQRQNIVLTKKHDFDYAFKMVHSNVTIAHSIDEIQKYYDSWVIGGAMVYQALMPWIDEAYITRIEGNYNCDVFMPEIPSHVKVTERFMNKEGKFI
jgi:dihydrofolate reductase